MSRKPRIKIALRVVVIGLVTVVAGGVLVLQAQGKAGQVNAGNPFDQILAKLDQIITKLTPGAVATTVTLSTPIVRVEAVDASGCNLVNVGTTPIARIDYREVGTDGVTVASFVWTNLQPGSAANSLNSGPRRNIRCEFVFQGTAAAARANLLVIDQVGHTLASADAR